MKHAYYIEGQRGKLYADWYPFQRDNGSPAVAYNYPEVLELGHVVV